MSHTFNAVRLFLHPIQEFVSLLFPAYKFGFGLADRTFRLICVVVNIWAIFAAQDFLEFVPDLPEC